MFAALAAWKNTDREGCRWRGGLAPWQVRRATEYLSENVARDVGLAELADMTGLSKSHFCRGFKETTGLSPHRWQLNARIDRAKQHLIAGDLPLAEIALELGFADQAHFTRAFGKSEGISPRAWLRARL